MKENTLQNPSQKKNLNIDLWYLLLLKIIDVTKGMLETARHKGIVPVQDTQRMIVWVLQHQAEAETMVTDILRLHSDLVEDVPQLRFTDIFHHHDSVQ